MNEIPPQQPPVPPGPPVQPGQPGQPGDPLAQQQYVPAAPGDDQAKRLKRMMTIGGVVALALIAGAFLFGQKLEKDKYKPGEDAYQEIYAAGQQSGTTTGTETGKQEGKKEGKETGKEEGLAEGEEKGKRAGLSEGETQGQGEGANAALGGLSGWSTDAPYVVEFQEGPSNEVPVAVSRRWLMQPGVQYGICSSGEGICQYQSSSGGSSSGGSGSGGSGSGDDGTTSSTP